MLTFYRSSQLELLADKLIKLYAEHPLANSLEREIIVVQNHGMARWLSTRMARKSGIAANLKFEFPAERVWDIYRTMDEDIPGDLPSDREPMTWTIYQELKTLPRESPYLAVWNYMRDEDGSLSFLKTWKLANRIGDLFDQYLIYRPKMIRRWEQGQKEGLGASEAWQSALWNRLNTYWDRTFDEIEWNHRASIHDEFVERLNADDIAPSKLPERITLFGLSGLAESSIEAFTGISKITDVHWFWADPASKNSCSTLGESWGGEREEFLSLFKKYSKRVNKVEEVVLKNQSIQNESDDSGQVTFNFQPSISNQKEAGVSIQVHSCHSPLREVEVLRDNLFDLFEHNPDLEPDDILILSPDIQTFAPFVEAVFGTTEEGLPDLPFHIVDDYTGTRKEVFHTFSAFLELLDSRFKVTEVLDLLSTRVVRERFEISEDELDRLHQWIEETNIRWGLSGEDKQQMGVPGSSNFTWLFGLNRMMLGFASQFEESLFEGVYPYNQIESSDDATLLGKLSQFVNMLSEARRVSRTAHSITHWTDLLNKWIEDFIPATRDYFRAYQGLNSLIENMQEAAELGSFEEELHFPVLLDYLQTKLTGEAARGGYFGYGITFSGLDQMRNIPCKVIGMIGMNNEAFPRNKVSPDFDLMAQDPREGDRSQRNDDRYLFLETMQSAREQFYLSYTGQSNRDDSTRPPSVMISELIDYLREERGMKIEDVLVEHLLHRYSSRYFKEKNTNIFSYSPGAFEVSKTLAEAAFSPQMFLENTGQLPEADDSYRQLSINDLAQFYTHPARYLLQNRLGIYFRDEEVIEDEREPFELKGLAGYQLGEELLKRMLENKDNTNFEQIAHARGMLPEGWPGRQAYRDKGEEVEDFGAAATRYFSMPKLDNIEISLEIGDFHLTGVLDSIYSKYQLFLRYGSMRAKDLLRLWIHHLVFQHVEDLDHPFQSLLITKDNNQPREYPLPRIKNSGKYLENLLELYWIGLHRKLPLFVDTSFTYAHEIIVRRRDHSGALYQAGKQWSPSWNPQYGENEDPYNKLLFKHSEPIGSKEFREISLNIWRPVFETMESQEGPIG